MIGSAKEKKVSGRMVLITLVGFFAIITAVNATMATLAIRTFGGVEADNPYRAGLQFAREIDAAKAQQARNLRVDVTTSKLESGRTAFLLTVRDIEPGVTRHLSARLELRHPADKRHDRVVPLNPAGGAFAGDLQIEPGQWTVTVLIDRGNDRIFKSVNQITIR